MAPSGCGSNGLASTETIGTLTLAGKQLRHHDQRQLRKRGVLTIAPTVQLTNGNLVRQTRATASFVGQTGGAAANLDTATNKITFTTAPTTVATTTSNILPYATASASGTITTPPTTASTKASSLSPSTAVPTPRPSALPSPPTSSRKPRTSPSSGTKTITGLLLSGAASAANITGAGFTWTSPVVLAC